MLTKHLHSRDDSVTKSLLLSADCLWKYTGRRFASPAPRCETKLLGEPCGQSLPDLRMRNCVSSLNIINPFLKRSHKTHSINDLIHRRIVRKLLNSLYYKLLLIHGAILRHDGKSVTPHRSQAPITSTNGSAEGRSFRISECISAFPRTLGVLCVLCAKSPSLLKIRSRAKIAKLTKNDLPPPCERPVAGNAAQKADL